MNRNEFFYKLLLLCFSGSGFVKKQVGVKFMDQGSSYLAALPATINQPPVIGFDKFIDLHCHSGLKFYLWNKKIWQHHPSKKGNNAFNMQVDVPKLLEGKVTGFVTAHYLPERGLITESKTVKFVFPFVKFFASGLVDKIEEGSADNFRQLLVMMDQFEAQVNIANTKLRPGKNAKDVIKIARSFSEFEELVNSGTIAAAQSVEGAHSLGRGLDTGSPDAYLLQLEILFKRGVCMLTLAHFFQNDLSTPVEGMAPYTKAMVGYKWKYNPDTDNKPLSANGKSVVIKMLELGMIVDVSHLSPRARMEIFELNKNYKRPVIFSHTGVQHLFNGPKEYDAYKYYCASDDDLRYIKECNGVVGIIFMTYFLTGNDEHLVRGDQEKWGNIIDHIIQTIAYIRTLTASYDNIALGSDFDNFGNAPSDLRDPSFFPALLSRLKQVPGITEEEISKLTHGNALRVLREGWKR